jgi:hypothetical protein
MPLVGLVAEPVNPAWRDVKVALMAIGQSLPS